MPESSNGPSTEPEDQQRFGMVSDLNPETVRIFGDYSAALMEAIAAGDAPAARKLARTADQALGMVLEVLDPDGWASADVTHFNGTYRGTPWTPKASVEAAEDAADEAGQRGTR